MLREREIVRFCDRALAAFELRIGKLFHAGACETQKVVMVGVARELVYGLPRVEHGSREEAGVRQLTEHAVGRCGSHRSALVSQDAIHLFDSEMQVLPAAKELEYPNPRRGGFQPCAVELLIRTHGHVERRGN